MKWNIKRKDNKPLNFDGSKCFLTNWTVTDESSWTRVVFICFNQKDFASAPCLLCEMFDPRLLLTVIEVQLTLSVGDSLQHSRECPEWPAVEGLLCLMFSVTITTSYNFGGYLWFIWRGDFEISNFKKITNVHCWLWLIKSSVKSVILIQLKFTFNLWGGCLSLNFDKSLESLSSSRTLWQTRHLHRGEIE